MPLAYLWLPVGVPIMLLFKLFAKATRLESACPSRSKPYLGLGSWPRPHLLCVAAIWDNLLPTPANPPPWVSSIQINVA